LRLEVVFALPDNGVRISKGWLRRVRGFKSSALLGGAVLSVWFDRADRAMAPLRRALAYHVSVEALIELAVWLAIPYLAIGLVWALVHPEQTQQLQTRLERVLPAGADVGSFGLMMAFWPASLQIADACPTT
jgi:hypothetical protein